MMILMKLLPQCLWHVKTIGFGQECNERKVISEVYASFVLQCTVSGR